MPRSCLIWNRTLTLPTQTYVNLLLPLPLLTNSPITHPPSHLTPDCLLPPPQKKPQSTKAMATEQTSKSKGILDRLTRLEHSQNEMMQRLKSDHETQMRELREKLERANQKRREAENHLILTDSGGQPLLMEVNMTEVEAAVQAASFAEQESALALEEARKVAEDARLAAGGIPKSARDSTKDGDVAYGADSEYIFKKVSVNLDEVERAISHSPLVNVCRAFGRPDSKYGNEVYCAVVPKKNVRISEPMLFVHAQKYLPTAWVPKRFFVLEYLPSGITRKALAETQLSTDPAKPLPAPAPAPPSIEN